MPTWSDVAVEVRGGEMGNNSAGSGSGREVAALQDNK